MLRSSFQLYDVTLQPRRRRMPHADGCERIFDGQPADTPDGPRRVEHTTQRLVHGLF